jgi:formate hydrogenlyase subunit 4
MPYSYGYPNLYPLIILILIVLQWALTPTGGQGNLTDNGGLFIITLFALIYCSCYSRALGSAYGRYYY